MIVQVDSSELQAMEERINMMTQFLTVAVFKRKGKRLLITEKDVQKIVNSNVDTESTEEGLLLIWRRND